MWFCFSTNYNINDISFFISTKIMTRSSKQTNLEFLTMPSFSQIVFLIVFIFKKGIEVYWSNIHEQHQYICCHCSEKKYYQLTYELIWPQMKITSNKIEKTKRFSCAITVYVHCKSCVKLHVQRGFISSWCV